MKLPSAEDVLDDVQWFWRSKRKKADCIRSYAHAVLEVAAEGLQLVDVDAYDEPNVVIEKLQAYLRKLEEELT